MVGSVLVTGASRGVGLELVRQLAKLPSPPTHIFATCRYSEIAKDLHDVSREHKAVRVIDLDVKDAGSIQFASHLVNQELEGSGLNILINNACLHLEDECSQTPSQVPSETLVDMYRTNVFGPFLVTTGFLPLLRLASKRSDNYGMGVGRTTVMNISNRLSSMTERILQQSILNNKDLRRMTASLRMVASCLFKDLDKESILTVPLYPGHEVPNLKQITPEKSASHLINIISYLNEHKMANRLNIK